jgi:hypothetical protein
MHPCRYIHLIKLELPIKIDCGDFLLCSHGHLSFSVFGSSDTYTDLLFANDDSLGIYVWGESLAELVENIEEEIRERWESGEDCRCDQCLNLQEAFFEKKS